MISLWNSAARAVSLHGLPGWTEEALKWKKEQAGVQLETTAY